MSPSSRYGVPVILREGIKMSDTEHTIRHWDGKIESLPTDAGRVSKKALRVVDVGRAALHVVRALRRAVEIDCARKLAAIDEQIRAEGG